MSQNTNKLFWISAMVIVFVALGFMIYNNVGEPSNTLYNNANAETLCNSFYKKGLVNCLDASSNTKEGQYSKTNTNWFDQVSNKDMNLTNFEFNDKSGWDTTSLLFDGIDDFASINIDNNFEDKFSLLLNLKLIKIPSQTVEIISNEGVSVKITPAGKIEVTAVGINGNQQIISQNRLEENSWYSIMISYDNDLLKLYINGQIDSKIAANLGNIKISDTLTIGNVNMYVSSFALWNSALDDNEVNQNTLALNNKTLDIDKYIVTFDYTGDCVQWFVPYNGEYQIELWGAQGGSFNSNKGGTGAYTSGNIELAKDEFIYVCVGEQGNDNNKSFNGTPENNTKYAGGGATDIRLNYNNNWNSFGSLKSRIMVAAGGGTAITSNGGAGGIEAGQNAFGNYTGILNATGGKQKVSGNNIVVKDGFNKNELSDYLIHNDNTSGFGYAYNGGGNGYFAGGGAGNKGAGAGGSSYISGYDKSVSLHAMSKENDLVFTDVSHYSGYEFTSPKIESGTTKIVDPLTKEETIGKQGNGYARITLIKTLDNVKEKVPSSTYFSAPKKPVVSTDSIGENLVTVTWEDTGDAQKYECYYSIDGSEYKPGMVMTVLGQQQYCMFNQLKQNTDYSYKVVASNGDKSSESDIKTFKTQYHTPIKPNLLTYEITDTTMDVNFNVDRTATEYICYMGETKDSQENVIDTTIDGDKVKCSLNNLTQNKEYSIRLDIINGDKKTSSDVVSLNTAYETPEKLVLTNYETTLHTINANFKNLKNYTDVKCYIGADSTDITQEIDTEIYSDSVTCKADNLAEGTNYYIQALVLNDVKSSISDINTIRTKYQTPEIPTAKENIITKNSIITIYKDNNSGLSNSTYSCSYGTSVDNMNLTGTVIEGLNGEKRCEYNNLTENTTYYTRFTVRNGTEYIDSEINILTTDYEEPNKPVYNTSYFYNDNNIYAKYYIENPNHSFKCYYNNNGKLSTGEATVNATDKYLECRYTNLAGGEYIFYSSVQNGQYIVESDHHSLTMDAIIPTLTVTVDNSQFNTAGWAKKNIAFNIKAETRVNSQISGLAYCIDSSNCEPSFDIEQEASYLGYTPKNNKTYIERDFKDNMTVYMTGETTGSKICFQVLYGANSTETQCYGPYKLDKTKPTITGKDVTIADTVTSYDIYSGLTIKDNYTATANITKSYDKAPTWGDSGTYNVTYTVTDAAGNSQTLKRTFTITLTTFNISYNLNGGSATNPATYNKKTNSFTLNNPTRTGYTFTGWSGTGISGKSKSVTISKGSSGNRSYTANWQQNVHTVNYYINGGWYTSNSVGYGNGIPQPGVSYNGNKQVWSGWQNVPGSMPDYDINVTGTLRDINCHVSIAAGYNDAWRNYTMSQFNAYVGPGVVNGTMIDGTTSFNFDTARAKLYNLWNSGLPNARYYSKYMTLSCENGGWDKAASYDNIPNW